MCQRMKIAGFVAELKPAAGAIFLEASVTGPGNSANPTRPKDLGPLNVDQSDSVVFTLI